MAVLQVVVLCVLAWRLLLEFVIGLRLLSDQGEDVVVVHQAADVTRILREVPWRSMALVVESKAWSFQRGDLLEVRALVASELRRIVRVGRHHCCHLPSVLLLNILWNCQAYRYLTGVS